VPKYDGDMGRPNVFVPIDDAIRRRKIEHLMTYFDTQLSRRWFTEDLFSGCCACAGWSATPRATSPRRSTAARRSCSKPHLPFTRGSPRRLAPLCW
jgi:hypothetical protein